MDSIVFLRLKHKEKKSMTELLYMNELCYIIQWIVKIYFIVLAGLGLV